MNFLIWASIEMVISNNPWFVYDEDIFTPKELDNFKKSYAKAKYGDRLLVNLSKDLTRLKGRGFSRSVLTYMRKFYLAFPKCATVSHKLSWSHYIELLKCEDSLEMQFYMKECIKEGWKVRELKRQINSSLFQRLALSTDKEGVLALANEGHQVMSPADIIRDPYVLEFTGLPQRKQYKESELEKALKTNMEQFLLELGRGFAFMGRQYVIPMEADALRLIWCSIMPF